MSTELSRRAEKGADIARLLLRGVVGGTMIAHGIKHARSLEGTAGWFKSIGFRDPELQATASAVVEIGGGGALLLGAGTPFAAASIVGTMGVAARSVHQKNGFFITAEGYEYVLNLAAAAVAAAALGPGRFSVDRLLRVDRRAAGLLGAGIAAGLGLAGAAAQLKMFWRDPAAAEPADEDPA